jgi:integrase
MPILKLTKRSVDALEPAQKAYFARDTDLKGFVCRVYPTGLKSWGVTYRPHPGGRGVAEKFVTLGKIGTLTPDQARQAAADILAKVRLGSDPGQERAERRKTLTVSEFLTRFDEDYIGLMVKTNTAVSHRLAVEELRAAHGNLKIDALTRNHIATLHVRMASRPYAANRALAVWSRAFVWGSERGFVPEGFNPAKGIQKYKEQGRERFLTSDELSRLGAVLVMAEKEGLPYTVDETKSKAKHAPKPENRLVRVHPSVVAAIRLLILTGARLREILNAKWSEVDLDRGVLRLADSKTGKKTIYLSDAAIAIVKRLTRIEDNPYLIVGDKEGSNRSDIKRPWEAIRKAADLEELRLHDLRHSFASFGASASLGLPIIGKLLGHTQASTTQRYAHLDADPLHRAANVIGGSILEVMNKEP